MSVYKDQDFERKYTKPVHLPAAFIDKIKAEEKDKPDCLKMNIPNRIMQLCERGLELESGLPLPGPDDFGTNDASNARASIDR